jgi:lipopolysaccharide biosynthesis glycosyltransferase
MVITKPDIYIFYSTDSAGVQQLAVSLLSLVQSKGKTSTYRIYIGHKDIHKAEMDFLTAVVGPYSKCYIYFHNCIKYEEKFNILPIDGHIMGSY